MMVFVLFCLLCILGCDDECRVEETRCDGNIVQVCNTNERWENIHNCKKIGMSSPLEFQCEFDAEYGQHVCVPLIEEYDGGFDAGY